MTNAAIEALERTAQKQYDDHACTPGDCTICNQFHYGLSACTALQLVSEIRKLRGLVTELADTEITLESHGAQVCVFCDLSVHAPSCLFIRANEYLKGTK